MLLKLRAEVRDLQEGHMSIEERARFQHGMLEKGEIFIQLRPSFKSFIQFLRCN